jgi:hypothetical protein
MAELAKFRISEEGKRFPVNQSGMRFAVPPGPDATTPQGTDPTAAMTPQGRAAYWENQGMPGNAGFREQPVINWSEGNRQGSYLNPANPSNQPAAQGLRPQNVEVMRGANTQTESFAPAEPQTAGFRNGPRLNADGTYTHAVGPEHDGYQRVATGSKTAFYEGDQEIEVRDAKGNYVGNKGYAPVFRNAATGASFASMPEAEANAPAETALGFAKGRNLDAEGRLLGVKADLMPQEMASDAGLRSAQARLYNEQAAQGGFRQSAGADPNEKWVQTEQITGYDSLGAPITSKVLVQPGTGARYDATDYGGLAKGAYAKLDIKRRKLVDDYLGDRDADPKDILSFIQSLPK